MSALRGKELADLTDQTLENMRNEHDLACYTKQYHQQQFQESEESPIIKYCITGKAEATVAGIIRKIRMSITNQFMTKLWILLFTLSKQELTNQHLSCLLKQSSCFWKQWGSRMAQISWKFWRHISKVIMIPLHSPQSFNYFQRSSKLSPSIWKKKSKC